MMKNNVSKNSTFYFLIAFTIFQSNLVFGQKESRGDSLKAAISSFVSAHSESHSKKHLNLRAREIGSLENEPFEWKDYFMLESNEEFENNLGYTTEREMFFIAYHYKSETDRQYALKYWMEEFIEGKAIRVARPVRSYPYAKPTIVLINPTNIIICTYECKYYDEYDFEDWKDSMMEHFGNKKETIVLELVCEGPLNWTLNAPDPKTRELF
jgi:hypothetical protein